jgi:hypothetical protein
MQTTLMADCSLDQHWELSDFLPSTVRQSERFRQMADVGSGEGSLLWMQGTYSSHSDFAMSVVGFVQSVPEPSSLNLMITSGLVVFTLVNHRRQGRKTPN